MLNFPNIEEEILKYWQEHDIFQKTLAKDSPKGPFTFYDGPPTANGRPGLHHVLARIFKDFIPRFKTMQGYRVERQAGWDTHGLPVELEVEKALKISGKPEIEKYGIERFNNECRKSVWKYQEEWERLTERIAHWLDYQQPYVTYSKDYIESLWWIFKQIYERGLLYQGYKVVPQCPRCGTVLSSHEVAQGYEKVTEPSVYIKFKVKSGQKIGDFTADENTYILSWTTTPWTLPGNVALAVNLEVDYYIVPVDRVDNEGPVPKSERKKIGNVEVEKINLPDMISETFILAKDRYSDVLKILMMGELELEEYNIKEIKGSQLKGLEYYSLFPGAIPKETENYQNAFKVYPADFVTTADGTGIVHTAVMYGEDDYNLGSEVGLPKFHTVDENGKFLSTVKEWTGRFVKEKSVEQGIIKNLEERGLLLKIANYTHDYPFCWRCESPLLYYAKNSWFIKMSEVRKKLISENQKINWVPSHIKEGRFGEWLAGAKDWAISRERYWGTPLPIWQCSKCQKIQVIGGYEELAKESGSSKPLEKDFDPHKPYIDEYKFKCGCGGEMKRIKEVGDCWFDSGAMPFAQYHYPFENKKKVDGKDYYPADYITEAIDQTRGWFYSLLAIGVLLGRGTPYKNVICLGHINDAEGKKMSKHLGNIINPWEVINKWGADALRFHLFTINAPGEAKSFDVKNVEEVVKKNFLILFNVLTFYKTYHQELNLPDKLLLSGHILDQWIIAKLNQLISGVTANLEKYNIFSAARAIMDFINELSTWYLRRSRERFKSDDLKDKEAALNTLGYVLLTLSKIMAPFTPFVAEELYRQLGSPRGAAGGSSSTKASADLRKESVHLEEWPKAESRKQKAESKILEDMEVVRKIVELALAKRDEAGIKVRQVLGKVTVSGASLSDELTGLIKDEINVKEVVFQKGEKLSVELETALTDELKEEGLYRELVRTINQLRKEARLTINDKVVIYYQTDSELVKKVINQFEKELLKNTISQKIIEGKTTAALINKETQVNGESILLALK